MSLLSSQELQSKHHVLVTEAQKKRAAHRREVQLCKIRDHPHYIAAHKSQHQEGPNHATVPIRTSFVGRGGTYTWFEPLGVKSSMSTTTITPTKNMGS